MTMYLKKISKGEAVEGNWLTLIWPVNPVGLKKNKTYAIFYALPTVDVLEVLTEVDEKSRRNPEIIQYFIVSH